VKIGRVGEAELGDLLPLVRAYCDFYAVSPSDEELLTLSRALIADPEREGVQLLARDAEGRAVGFATIFWSWATTSAERIGVMNDLFVTPEARGSGNRRGVDRDLPSRMRSARGGQADLADSDRQRTCDEGLRPHRCNPGDLGRLLAAGLPLAGQQSARPHGNTLSLCSARS